MLNTNRPGRNIHLLVLAVHRRFMGMVFVFVGMIFFACALTLLAPPNYMYINMCLAMILPDKLYQDIQNIAIWHAPSHFYHKCQYLPRSTKLTSELSMVINPKKKFIHCDRGRWEDPSNLSGIPTCRDYS